MHTIFLFCFFSVVAISEQSTQSKMVDLYNLLPIKEDTSHHFGVNSIKYKLFIKDQKWQAKCLYDDSGKVIYPIVDDMNGYFKIHEEVNSASLSSLEQEMALFTTTDRKLFIALNIDSYWAPESREYFFRFYEVSNNIFKDRTESFEQNIDWSLFFKTKMDYKKFVTDKNIDRMVFSPKIKLPKEGTIIKIYVDTDSIEIALRMSKATKDDKKEIDFIENYLKSVNRIAIEYEWDSEKGKFKLKK